MKLQNNNALEIFFEQKTKEWFLERRKYITASDVCKIIAHLEGENYYEGVQKWVKVKLGLEKISFGKTLLEIMKKGELAEEIFKKEVLDNIDNKDFYHGKTFVKDKWLLASFDSVEYIYNEGKNVLVPHKAIEIKFSTRDGPRRNKYLDRTDYAFYQLCAQMYCLNLEEGILVVIFGGEDNEKLKYKKLKLNTKDEIYKNFLKHIPYLKEIHKKVCIEKTNPFDKNHVPAKEDKFEKLSIELIKLEKECKESKERYDILRENLIELIKKGHNKIMNNPLDNNSYTWVLSDVSRKNKKLKQGLLEENVFDFEEKNVCVLKKKIIN